MSLASALIEPLPVSSLHVPSGWLAGEQGFTPEDALWNSSRRKKRNRLLLTMRVQPYSQRKEDASCAGFIQPPERVHCIPPPSNPRLDGGRSKLTLQSQHIFSDRPALGWTVTDNSFSDLETYRKCQRSLPLLARQLFSLVHSIQVTVSRKDIGEPSLNWLLPSQESSTSWVKRCLRLWLTNLMGWPLYVDHVDVKRRAKHSRRLSWSSFSAPCHPEVFPLILASAVYRPSQHAASAIAARLNSPRSVVSLGTSAICCACGLGFFSYFVLQAGSRQNASETLLTICSLD